MDRNELLDILHDLDKQLPEPCDLILVGGAAMILYFGASRATRDIDVLVLRGNLAEIRRAVESVALEHALPQDWLNDAVNGFADILPRDFYHRLVPFDLPLDKLRLYILGRPEQAAMKIVALCEQDLEDLELLLPNMTDDDRDVLLGIMNHVASFRPDWALKIRYFLQEYGWDIV